MKAWYLQLAPRERMLVAVAGILGMFALVVILGVRPIVQSTARGRDLVEQKRELLSEIDQVAERIGPQAGTGGAASGAGNQSLVVVVDRTTRANGLAPYLKRNQPDGTSSIRLRFEDVPFDALMEWLASIRNQQGLEATSANIDKAVAQGRVNCNLTLSRAGR